MRRAQRIALARFYRRRYPVLVFKIRGVFIRGSGLIPDGAA
jgi:hypothetical protein